MRHICASGCAHSRARVVDVGPVLKAIKTKFRTTRIGDIEINNNNGIHSINNHEHAFIGTAGGLDPQRRSNMDPKSQAGLEGSRSPVVVGVGRQAEGASEACGFVPDGVIQCRVTMLR